MQNAKPRFALIDDQTMYDYATATEFKIGVQLHCAEGIWDTNKVAELIRSNKSIEPALTPNGERERLIAEENAALKAALKRAEAEIARLTAEKMPVTELQVDELGKAVDKVDEAKAAFVEEMRQAASLGDQNPAGESTQPVEAGNVEPVRQE